VLVATMAAADEPRTEVDDAWLGLAPMYWSNWDAATNRRLVRDAGLDLIDAHTEAEDEGGRTVTFLWVIARRPPLASPGGGGDRRWEPGRGPA
jgi:hypothetical protein